MKQLISTLTLIFAAAITSFACVGEFTYTIENNVVVFHGTSDTPGVTYQWNFGDQSDATGQNVTHTYSLYPEYYNVCLTITDGLGCTDEYCATVFVQTGPPAPCEGSFTYTVDGATIAVHGSANINEAQYYWFFGDGTPAATGPNQTHTYDIYPEHYEVCMVIVNGNLGCQDTICQTILVEGPSIIPCEASFTYTITGTQVHFQGVSNIQDVTYSWTFGDGTQSDDINPVHNYTQSPEHYAVCLTIHNSSGCEDQVCDTILIESTTPEECHASFTYSVSGNEVQFHGSSNTPGVHYTWHFGDGTTGSGENPVHNYTLSPENYNVCLTIYNDAGCENTYCHTVFVEGNENPSNCEASFTYTLEGNVAVFHGTSTVPGVDYTWSFGDGNEGTGENVTHTFTTFPAHYSVCLTIHNGDGCENTVCHTINVQSSGGGGQECEASFTYTVVDNSVQFTGHSNQDNVDYGWSFGDGSTGTGQAPTHTYTVFPEHYNVCLYIWNNTTGCHDTICQTVYVQHGSGTTCSAEFTYTITGNEVHFTGPSNADGTHYEWSFGDGHSSDMHNPNYAYTLFPENYEVCLTVTNSGNGCSEESCQTIFVEHGNSPDLFELSGIIFTGQDYADAGYVWLIQYDVNTGNLQAVQTVEIGANGHYVFNAPAGNYFLKAALSSASAVYANYLPTYFEHELFWYDADVISLTSNLNRNIHMIGGNNPGGPGFIGGLVTEGANKVTGPGDPVEGVQVMLLNMNDEPLQYTYSNAFGEFSFNNVAYGTYQVYGEVYNLTTVPAIVTIDGSNMNITDIGLLITSKEVTTGVNEVAVINETSVGQVFPNPFKGDAAVNISLSKEARLSIRLFDIAGRQVYADIMNFGAGVQQINLPVSALNAGIYSLTLSDEKSNTMVTRKLMKTE
jgi:PKD repeat protein